MKISIGNPVVDEDFFDREDEQSQIWRKLEKNHLLLLAPRRIGKTSLMLRLCTTAAEHSFKASMASFAPCNNEMDCIERIAISISETKHAGSQFLGKFNQSLQQIKGIKFNFAGIGGGFEFHNKEERDWRKVGEALVQSLAQSDGMQLICIDELPIFILKLLDRGNGLSRSRSFLYWFRDLRQNFHKNVRWIAAGSIGMDTVTGRFGLGDTINDLDTFPLGAFSNETANRFLGCLADSYNLPLSKDVRHYMIQRVGWPVPYYLQLMLDKLLSGHDNGNKKSPVDNSSVDMAFEELLSPPYKIHFDYWRQRLDEELGSPDAGHALHLLNAACRDQSGVSQTVLSQVAQARIPDPDKKEKTMRYLLDVLENDGYLIKKGDRYHFRLEWLREYWLRRVL